MLKIVMRIPFCLLLAMSSGVAIAQPQNSKIVHDAEYYILEAQNGKKWAIEDGEIDKKLAALRKKHGVPPNIVYILWDDMTFGAVGFPSLQKNFGFTTPNLHRMAREGINFTRMYTEPSCTPTRVAFLTGRHPVRCGMGEVGMPHEMAGLPGAEVTIAEVLSKAGYATAHFGKGHLGDIVHVTDLYTTFARLAGASIARPQDLVSGINANPASLTQFQGTQFTFGGAWIEPIYNLQHSGGVLPNLGSFAGKSTAQGSALGNIGVTQDFSAMGLPAPFGLGLVSTAGCHLPTDHRSFGDRLDGSTDRRSIPSTGHWHL